MSCGLQFLVVADAVAWSVGGLIGALAGAGITFVIVKQSGLKVLNDARDEATRVVEQGKQDAENLRKQGELDAREEQNRKREEFEKESNKTRNELKDAERRVAKREDNLDRKLDMLTTKEKHLEQVDKSQKDRESKITSREKELDELVQKQREQLTRVTGLSEDDAKKMLFEQIETECRHEAGQIVQAEMNKAEEESKDNARKVVIQAIQRYAAEHTAAATVSTVDIPSDDMKGRVIGREGRNIRAFEQATGVDVIVDDTPGVVVVSCFDPVRRAVAAEALEKLINDGRIHPARIEEVVKEIRQEIDERIVKFGKDACIETNIRGLHPQISKMMGQLHYRTSYGQNILRHSVEVAFLSQVIADELGLDGSIARRAGFLHDIGKAMDHEKEGGHPAIGMEFCRKYKEREEVLNAIGGHHGDIEPTSFYTPIVASADAISGARPGARRDSLERYIQRLEQLEGIATSVSGVTQAFAIQAGREVRVMVDAAKVDDATNSKIARDIAKRVEEEMTYPGEVCVTVLRELRSVEYAR